MAGIFQINEAKNGIIFEVRVTPGASRAQIAGFQEGVLKIKVTAQPVEGAANIACIKLIAELLKLKKSQIEIIAGAKSRKKTVLVRKMTKKELELKVKNI